VNVNGTRRQFRRSQRA